MPNHPWTVDDHPYAAGSGAAKLVSSGVAPLVGMARGMRTITRDDIKPLLADYGFAPTSVQGRQIKAAIGASDALWMPWFGPAEVLEMATSDVDLKSPAPQLRPARENVIGDAKYVNLYDRPLVIGPHPATPASWIQTPGKMMFTEGMLKADSALTAQLLAAGTSPEALFCRAGETLVEARARLRGLMEAIEPDQRVTIIGFVSVTTFGKNPEWNFLRAGKDARCWCAFDGDVRTNRMVWDQANKLRDIITSKNGDPKLLDLSAAAEATGDAHLGIDDFLAEHGGWNDLLALGVDNLPPRPFVEKEHQAGEWRMDDKTCRTQAWQAPANPGEQGGWATKHAFVARVVAIETRRSLSAEEFRSGTYDPNTTAAGETSRCEIEVAWIDEATGKRVAMTCAGPDDMLVAAPSEWRRIPGVVVPPKVKALKSWPPKEAEFLAAMKEHRVDECIIRPQWDHMGWVPALDGRQVFLVGDQVIGADGFDDLGRAVSAVDNHEVARASSFGVQIPFDDDEARDAIRRVLDLYRPLDQSMCPWRDARHASIVLAAGLRPAVPVECRTAVAYTGSSGAGKTFSMAASQVFWSAEPGSFGEDRLPGSASDTAAAAEVAISKTVMWPVDDLAPSPSEPGGGRKTDQVWELVRSVSNGSARSRRNAQMGAQAVNTPRALLMISAEQAPENKQSIMNRYIGMRVLRDRFLSESRVPTDVLRESYGPAGDCPQSMVTGFIVRMLARRAEAKGWQALTGELRAAKDDHAQMASAHIEGSASSQRQTKTVADLALGLTVLEWACDELGILDELEDRLVAIADDLYRTAADSYASARTVDLGPQVLESLASVLASHKAHVGALGQSGVPVSAGTLGFHADANTANDRLGWELPVDDKDRAKACGPRIGQLLTDDDGRLAVVFDVQASFAVLGAQYRANTANEVWQAVVSSKLHHQQWKARTSGGGAGWKQRPSRNGTSVEGVVVPLWRIFGNDGPEDIGQS